MSRPLTIVGNWKMHGDMAHIATFFREFQRLVQTANNKCDIVICPPFCYLSEVAACIASCDGVALGAQDVSPHQSGAYTGDIAASMLVDQHCRMVIVGHSERRQHHGEDDQLIADKFFAAKNAGLIPILCVGETSAQRKAGLTESVITSQLTQVLQQAGKNAFQSAIVAYEPVWAIGTGLTATPEEADAIHDLIRRQIGEYDPQLAQSTSILYGGSVKGDNAAALLSMPNIDGALVGGASLKAEAFWEICHLATQELTLSTQG